MKRALVGSLAVAVVITQACNDSTPSNTDAGTDAGVDATIDSPSDAPFQEGGGDSGDPPDAGDADADPSVYSSLADTSKWATFDLTTVNSGIGELEGAAFDGRYVYFVPSNDSVGPDGRVPRYDTLAAFTTAGSWSTFDTTTVDSGAKGFAGAAFDGRYVYLAPFRNGTTTIDGLVGRYDTQATFSMATSWSTFDMTTVDTDAIGFVGAVFDGRYVYYVPYNHQFGGKSVVGRYDTQAAFGASASWSTFDLTTVNASVESFFGGVFDGRYVYFVPNIDGIVGRYDTQASFTSSSAWSTFNVATVNAGCQGSIGAVFDGRYVYVVPHNPANPDGLVERYDTQASFTNQTSWSTFDMTTVDGNAKGFGGGAFDGRYIYFIPLSHTVIGRYDTKATFTSAGAWSTFDMTTVSSKIVGGFIGAAFDGRNVYFVPPNGLAVRFDAKSPPSLPAGSAHGSFF
jgi:hypothetical protein